MGGGLGGGEGDGGGGLGGGIGGGEGGCGGGLGSPAAKMTGSHCGGTEFGFEEIGLLVLMPPPVWPLHMRPCQLKALSQEGERHASVEEARARQGAKMRRRSGADAEKNVPSSCRVRMGVQNDRRWGA